MKVRLLHPDRDVELKARLPWQLNACVNEDLELGRLYDAMAAGDAFLLETVKKVVRLNVADPEVIVHRQQVLADCLANRAVAQRMYDIAAAVDGVELRRKVFLGGLTTRNPVALLRRSVRILVLLTETLGQLSALSDEYAGQVRSTGFRQLLAMLTEQLAHDELARINQYLNEFHLPRGVLLSAQLGLGNKSEHHVLHQPPRRGLWARLTGSHNDARGFIVDDDDLIGAQALTQLAGCAVDDVANTLTQSAEHLQHFFTRLRTELGFYLGCVNLHDELTRRQVPTCFPVPMPMQPARFECRDLRDVGLCLTTGKKVTGNDVDANGKTLIVITGANEGGKSTFLRSIGAAQVMMQAGMFVSAEAFSASVRDGVFTHFTREEDATLLHGKLEEELGRMSALVEFIAPTSLLLCNESFASTNELEGSQIARDIIHTMVESGVRVFVVTHLYDLAHGLHARRDPADLFLRAERRPDGLRTFRLSPGKPEPTSHGEDSFRRIFGIAAQADPEPVAASPMPLTMEPGSRLTQSPHGP